MNDAQTNDPTVASRAKPIDEVSARYRANAARFTELIAAVPEDGWNSPSPCEEWTAADVLQHVIDTEQEFIGRMDAIESVDIAGLDRTAAFMAIRDRIQSALDDPEIAATTYDSMFGQTTIAATIDQFYSSDLVVHGWDIATAAGLEDHRMIPADEVDALLSGLAPLAEHMRQPGVFGPEIQVAADADPQTKLLAIAGRRA